MTSKLKRTEEQTETRAVELFSGIGGFRVACDRLKIPTVWANDVNPLSCEVYADAFGPNEIKEGDIRELRDDIPAHDLLTAGFPCQPFSSAGKKQGIRDPRGTLFQEIVRILERHSPYCFVLENVKRLLTMENGDHFTTILLALSKLNYFLEWRLLNATFFGLPQNRQRILITGRHISQFAEASILLAGKPDLENVIRHDLLSLQRYDSWKDLNIQRKKFPTWGVCFQGRHYSCDLDSFSDEQPVSKLADILEANPDECFFMDETTKERIKDSVFVNRLVEGVRIFYNQNGGARMGYTVFGTDGLAPALTASHSRHYERYKIGDRFRRLTNKEYSRLQGFSDDHCRVASVFNQYGLYGNAVPPPLAEWPIRQLLTGKRLILKDLEPVESTQMRLFA